MGLTIRCDIASAEKELFSGSVVMLIAKGEFGELGINYGHAPLLTSLQAGPVRIIKRNGEEEVFYVSGGFLEVQPTSVTVLANSLIENKEDLIVSD